MQSARETEHGLQMQSGHDRTLCRLDRTKAALSNSTSNKTNQVETRTRAFILQTPATAVNDVTSHDVRRINFLLHRRQEIVNDNRSMTIGQREQVDDNRSTTISRQQRVCKHSDCRELRDDGQTTHAHTHAAVNHTDALGYA